MNIMDELITEATIKPFKIVTVNGKKIFRDGRNGTGVRLSHICGFCRDENGTPTAAFRSQKLRNRHANVCGG